MSEYLHSYSQQEIAYSDASSLLGEISTDLIIEQVAKVASSLNGFVDKLNERMIPLPRRGHLRFSHVATGKGMVHFGRSTFYSDGKYSVGLGADSDQGTDWLAIVGFVPGNKSLIGHHSLREPYPPTVPIINQLQAISPDDDMNHKVVYSRAADILSQFRWEHTLVDFIKEWAIREELPAIGILPGEFNTYYIDTSSELERNKRLLRRYNGTAKKKGFKRDKNGIYLLTLPPA